MQEQSGHALKGVTLIDTRELCLNDKRDIYIYFGEMFHRLVV